MTAPHDLADCCPECHPGDVPASLPIGEPVEEPERPGCLRAVYECPNGHVWVCWWDSRSAEWPAAREAA